ncbi:MAG: patatin-like phospholipase family protein [Leptospiraceae bacterium]|nr:patatin-like phospholipase family protein [Leptospiraceae bacterium]
MLNFPPFDSFSFEKESFPISFAAAGGGCKALFALGVGRKLKDWGCKIKEISGVSAGSAAALMLLSNKEEEGIEYFEELLKRNKKNFHFSKLVRGKRPWPHENMYRRTIRFSLDFDKIKKGDTKIFILAVKAFPRLQNWKNLWNKINLIPTTMRAVLLDDRDMERGVIPTRVKKIISKWKLKEVVFTEKDMESPEITEQIILNSSSIPPVLSFQKIKGEYYLDGGLTNNLLMEHFSGKYKKIGVYYENTTLFGKQYINDPNLFLVRPPGKLPIQTFDYTNSIGARETYELGKEIAEGKKKEILHFLRGKLI